MGIRKFVFVKATRKHSLPKSLHYAIRDVIFELGVFHGQNGSKIFVFINATIIDFISYVKKTPPYGEKTFLKSKKNILTSFLGCCRRLN